MAIRLNKSNIDYNLSVNSNTDSIQLANKIRKIKENLDNLNTSSNHNKSLNSTICSNSNLNDSRTSHVNSPSYRNNFTTKNPSKYFLVNHQAFDFEINNNPISLDNLALDQFSEKLTDSYYSEQEQLIPKSNHEIVNDNVKHAVYSENVSRQSSIRSLITEKNSKFLPNTSIANLNNNFAKIKKIKAKTQENLEFKEYDRDEIDLLQNWENVNFYENSPQSESKKIPSRPSTRLGFQSEDWNSNNLEYSDNVTIASSSSNETNSKYQDFTEEYESILVTPKSNKLTNEKNSTKKSPPKNNDDESESVLSDLVTNLQFDDQKPNHYTPNLKFKEFQHDFDVQTTSDVYSEENSLSLNNYNKLAQPSTPNMASVVIREKKIAQTKKLNNQPNALNESLLRAKLQNHINSSMMNEQKRGSPSINEDEKEKNYKRLSNTINNLFTNLIDNLEKQKNKDYLQETENEDYTKFNSSNLSNSNYFFNKTFDQINNPSPSDKNKSLTKQTNSNKGSNKDSGFNQELSSLNDSNSPIIPKIQSKFPNSNSYKDPEANAIKSRLKTFDFSTQAFNNDSNELSLLDRYLYNEQIVAEKHAKVEAVLQAFLNQQNLALDDYSIIEYILNQEGITIKTFKQLIKEKYYNIEWPNDLLLYLHQVVNEKESPRSDSNDNIDNISIYEDNFSMNSRLANGFDRQFSEIETRLNNKQLSRSCVRQDTAELSQSPSGSSRSYRRLKEIKNSTNSKKKQNMENSINNENLSQPDEERLINTLSNSFIKRRERKGSLPGIVTNQIIENDTMQSSQCSINSNRTLMNNSKNDEKSTRQSRKSAFVLEVLRTSMFRSKSLTDLNNSLIRFDNNTSMNRNVMTNSDYKNANKSVGANLHMVHLNNSTLNTSKPASHKYTGLVWQCADMCYPEYRNKYKEFLWLLNGDKVSTISKLKEIEQRLTIEQNLKEKNLGLIDELNKNSDLDNESSADKNMRTRLLNQLKVVNDKIKELEMMRLFLRICEINSHSLNPEDLDKFFKNPLSQHDSNNNPQKARSFLEILKMLFGNEAISTGFVYQFFVTYRYMCSSLELCEYFKQIFRKALQRPEIHKTKVKQVFERTIDLISMWIDGFYMIDFHQNQELLTSMESFLNCEIKSYSESKQKLLLNLIQNPNIEFCLFSKKTKYFERLNEKYRKQETDSKKPRIFNRAALKKRILNSTANLQKRARSSSKSKSVERSLYEARNQEDLNTTNSSIRIDFLVSDYPIDKIASQLTLIEWDNFLDIHVCHCLNSKAQGVNCDSKQPIDPNIISTQACLFVDNYLSKSVYKMIQFNYLLTHWVAAEILMSDTVKSQALLIMKFLKIAKKCCDWTNFSSAFSIFEGLQDITIRNLPAWQHVSSKSIQTLEKIISFKILFQNDPFAIYNLTKSTNLPVIPPMHLFLLIVQQNEHGSFQLANRLWKWPKLGFLANLVDQIRNVQQHYECNFEPCEDFVENLLQRIYYLKDFDLNNLSESSFLDYQSQKLNSSISTIKNLIPKKLNP